MTPESSQGETCKNYATHRTACASRARGKELQEFTGVWLQHNVDPNLGVWTLSTRFSQADDRDFVLNFAIWAEPEGCAPLVAERYDYASCVLVEA